MMISEIAPLVAWTWIEGASLAPQVISYLTLFLRALKS